MPRFIGDKPEENPLWNDPIFEQGRQHVLISLKKTFERRLKFLELISDQTENMTFSIEWRKGMIQTYNDVLDSIRIEDDWQRDRHLIASP